MSTPTTFTFNYDEFVQLQISSRPGLKYIYLNFVSVMESINKVLTLHKFVDPEKNLVVDHHWEVYDPILTCSNQ